MIVRRHLERFLTALLAVVLALGPAATVKPAAAAGRLKKDLRPQRGKILIGVFEEAASDGPTEFERTVGHRPRVINRFQAWASPWNRFDADWAKGLVENGQIPMVTWEPWEPGENFDQPAYRLKSVTQGAHDDYIKQWLASVRDWGGPIFVRFAQEMNGNWYPWGNHVNSGRDYVNAWRHIVDLSREIGADNITWVWAPNEQSSGLKSLQNYYPGKNYVDWVGMSGFNWGGRQEPWPGWRRFSTIFNPTLSWLKKYRKPIMIAEIGVVENPDGRAAVDQTKAAWIRDAFRQLKRGHPSVALVIWHNDVYRDTFDWRANSSPQSLEAIKRALDDPIFSE